MKNNKSGMTIVEVMVAFLILLLAMSGLYKAAQVSGNMIERAVAVQDSVDELTKYFYTENPQNEVDFAPVISLEGNAYTMSWKSTRYECRTEADGSYYLYGIEPSVTTK